MPGLLPRWRMIERTAAPALKNRIAGIFREEAAVGAHGWRISYISKSGFRDLRMSAKLWFAVSKAFLRVGMRWGGRPLVVW